MIYEPGSDTLIFECSGREFDPLYATVGLRLENLQVHGGWDQTFFYSDEEEFVGDEARPLTLEERIELADFMIAHWQRFKEVKSA